jgi:hypothetical protein
MNERKLVRLVDALQEHGQAFVAIEVAEAVGEVDPVPGLVHVVVAELAAELALQDLAGCLGADLGQGADADDILRAGTQPTACSLICPPR